MVDKKLIWSLVAVLVVVGGYFALAEFGVITHQPIPVPKISIDSCGNRCAKGGFSNGQCLRGGSALEFLDVCGGRKGVAINDNTNPIPGCNFEAIGSWDVCCCFK